MLKHFVLTDFTIRFKHTLRVLLVVRHMLKDASLTRHYVAYEGTISNILSTFDSTTICPKHLKIVVFFLKSTSIANTKLFGVSVKIHERPT